MLSELFLALLGFPGDIIVEDESTFKVKDGFDLLTQAEKEQINRVAPLGWYYVRLGAFMNEYDIQWGDREENFQAYRTSMSLGVSDLLSEYAGDVAYLEQLVFEGPIPLSHVLLHLQKYRLTMPVVYAMCREIELSNIRGCQVLDYLFNYHSGVPVVNDVIQQ